MLPDPHMKLTSFAIFWDNDKPGGYGTIIICHDDDMAANIKETLQFAEKGFLGEPDRDDVLAELRRQMEGLGLAAEKTKNDQWPMALVNVYLLQKYGGLVDDEYNGVIYNYEVKSVGV